MAGNAGVGRRDLLKGTLALGGVVGLHGRAAAQTAPSVPYRGPRLVPMRMTVNELIDIKACWLLPQPDSNYSVSFNGASALSKSDGVRITHNATTLGDMEGVGDSLELPDRALTEAGIALIAPVFAKMKGVRA